MRIESSMFLTCSRNHLICFKVHPRKMRIESICRISLDARRTRFKVHPRKMRIESWQHLDDAYGSDGVSRCILAKWGLKVVTRLRYSKSFLSFKVHPRKMRIERSRPFYIRFLDRVSRCILAKWGLKVSEYAFKNCLGGKFQGASSQNEDWKEISLDSVRVINKFQGASSQNEDWKIQCKSS